jgi:8-oxo-dGTP diphosphatase
MTITSLRPNRQYDDYYRGMSSRLRLNAAVAVDLVVLTVRADTLCVLAVRRGIEPYRDRWALPGGFVLAGEDLAAAAARELTEETGVGIDQVHLEQLGSYGDPGRDPRGRVVSVAYLSLAPALPDPVAGSDAAGARVWPVAQLQAAGLAFDHGRILDDGVGRARAKLEYTPLAASLCGPEFTVAELRRVYQAVWGTPLDPRNFHRKVTSTPGFVTPTGATTTRDGGRPAELFTAGAARYLHPPLLRPR